MAGAAPPALGGEPAVFNFQSSSMFLFGNNRGIFKHNLMCRFSDEVFAMTQPVEDLQMLRLIKAFQNITDRDTRRLVLLFVEEQLDKQLAQSRRKLGRTEH